MNVDEKMNELIRMCKHYKSCKDCPLCNKEYSNCSFNGYSDEDIETAYNLVFGKEEVNHPDRYASGQFECIDIMIDVYGKEAVKHFCILNAFKYLWRSENKNGVEDIKKAIWYMNKYIELGGDEE